MHIYVSAKERIQHVGIKRESGDTHTHTHTDDTRVRAQENHYSPALY